jgi:hypothetical protein
VFPIEAFKSAIKKTVSGASHKIWKRRTKKKHAVVKSLRQLGIYNARDWRKGRFSTTTTTRGGSGLIFLGLGRARVEGFGLGLLKFKIGFKAFKSWALITGLKIGKNCKNL